MKLFEKHFKFHQLYVCNSCAASYVHTILHLFFFSVNWDDVYSYICSCLFKRNESERAGVRCGAVRWRGANACERPYERAHVNNISHFNWGASDEETQILDRTEDSRNKIPKSAFNLINWREWQFICMMCRIVWQHWNNCRNSYEFRQTIG